jgi:peptide chain release factor 2
MVEELQSDVNNDIELSELLLGDNDETMLHNLEEDVNNLCQKLDKAEVYLLLSGPYDKNNCLLEIHSGAGGTEACDWADMLFRMYLRYLEKNNFKYEVLSYLDGDEVGLKSASIKVNGLYAYGYLKGEKGVHRLVRLSPFDANHKRHTSFASVDITPEFDNNIDIKIDEKDLKIDVYRASGAGGQHVNRTESAVRITHLPTKIVVTCQNERSQLQNKETCMNVLKGKLKLLEIEKQEQEMNNIKGDTVITSFGSQIRSYVMHPYSMVKDHRTGYETSNVNKVLDGDIEGFIESFLKG